MFLFLLVSLSLTTHTHGIKKTHRQMIFFYGTRIRMNTWSSITYFLHFVFFCISFFSTVYPLHKTEKIYMHSIINHHSSLPTTIIYTAMPSHHWATKITTKSSSKRIPYQLWIAMKDLRSCLNPHHCRSKPPPLLSSNVILIVETIPLFANHQPISSSTSKSSP